LLKNNNHLRDKIVSAPSDFQLLEERAAEASELLSAMSSPKRLLILCKLVEDEMSVLDLAGQVDLSQPALSQHLAKLRNLKLVKTRRDGNVIFYSLASEEVEAVLRTLYGIYCGPGQDA
jgi:DNA-binding transcriptional ArsR family regulator